MQWEGKLIWVIWLYSFQWTLSPQFQSGGEEGMTLFIQVFNKYLLSSYYEPVSGCWGYSREENELSTLTELTF